MDESQLLGVGEKAQMTELLAAFDAPAYVRRARGVEDALERLLSDCRRQREEWLTMVKLRLATLKRRAGMWPNLTGIANVAVLETLDQELMPQLRVPLTQANHAAVLRRDAEALAASIERFNRRWLPWLEQRDLEPINRLREGYNNWYVVEKACALRNDVLARAGYVPLPMLDHSELLRLMPLLPAVL